MFGRKQRREAWIEVATVLGGVHHPQTKWWRGDEHITATLQGVPVTLDTYVVSSGKSSQVYTRIAAPIALPPGVKSQCYRQGFWSAVGKLVGMQDIALGAPAFDAAHVVRSKNVAVVRRWWTDATRALMTEVADGRVTTDADEVKLVAAGRWREAPKMIAGMRLVAALAARDLYGVATLRQIEGAFSQPPGERPRVELDTGVRVVIMAEERDDWLVTTARVSEPLPHDALVLEIVDGRPVGETALPQAAYVHLASVGSGRLVIGPASAFLWNHFEEDPVRLRAGAALLGAFGPRAGIYR